VRESAQLRLVLVCDRCGAERGELGTRDYRPQGRRFVGRKAELTARELGLPEAEVARVRLAAMLADVGRDLIPAEILNKPGPLTGDEWTEVRRQPELGAALLCDASFDDIRDWILERRERVDGLGYPRALTADEITVEARILGVVDAYVAMISERPYRAARDEEAAAAELADGAGSQFDPEVVDAFLRAAQIGAPALASAAA
jgi:HD-GYP domain-containing protein (c-di-GMP phosphodiesterase class II)